MHPLVHWKTKNLGSPSCLKEIIETTHKKDDKTNYTFIIEIFIELYGKLDLKLKKKIMQWLKKILIK